MGLQVLVACLCHPPPLPPLVNNGRDEMTVDSIMRYDEHVQGFFGRGIGEVWACCMQAFSSYPCMHVAAITSQPKEDGASKAYLYCVSRCSWGQTLSSSCLCLVVLLRRRVSYFYSFLTYPCALLGLLATRTLWSPSLFCLLLTTATPNRQHSSSWWDSPHMMNTVLPRPVRRYPPPPPRGSSGWAGSKSLAVSLSRAGRPGSDAGVPGLRARRPRMDVRVGRGFIAQGHHAL